MISGDEPLKKTGSHSELEKIMVHRAKVKSFLYLPVGSIDKKGPGARGTKRMGKVIYPPKGKVIDILRILGVYTPNLRGTAQEDREGSGEGTGT
jgi:hypothetical protein